MNINFKVKVIRYSESGGCRSYNGCFISDVYAIDGNNFLVYDDENGFFEWVDFTEMYPDSDHASPESPPWENNGLAAVVTLWEGKV